MVPTMNLPEVFPEDHRIDQTSYCILLRLMESDEPLWKRELTRKLNGWRSGGLCPLNIDDEVNVQTVSRKTDMLVEEGLLEPVVIYPDGLERYVEAFRTTEQGRETLEEVSDLMLEELMARYADSCARSERLSLAPGVVERLSENATVDVDVETIEQLEEEFCSRLDGSMGGRLAVRG